MKTFMAPERGLQRGRMRCWWEDAHRSCKRQRLWWRRGVVVWCVLSVCCVPVLYSAPASRARQRLAQQSAPAGSPPPALPASVTERVLALSLENAIQLALQNNLDIERGRLDPQVQHTLVEQARAVFDPTVELTASLSQTKTLPQNQTIEFDPQTGAVTGRSITRPFSKDIAVTPGFKQQIVTGANYELRFINTWNKSAPASSGPTSRIENPRYQGSLTLTFTQPLLRNFGIAVNTALIRQAQHAEEIARQQLLQTILNTVYAVQQGYWELVFRIEDLGVKREAQKLAEDFLAENKLRVDLGALAPVELVQSETQVKQREGDVITAEAAVREAEDVLKETLNIPESMGTWRIRVLPTDTPPFVPMADISIDEKVAFALQHRPDVAQAQLTVASQEIARAAASNQRLPQLDLGGAASVSGFGGNFGSSTADIGTADGYTWGVSLTFTYPLGNRAANNGLQQQNLLLQQARIDQRKVQRTVSRQIFQTVRNLETASKRVEVTRAATVLARTQLEAEQEKFRLGLSTSFNVLQLQNQLTAARSDEIRALSDYNEALGQLDQVTGAIQYAIK
jgi:outer membrane protein TolC